MKKLILTFVMVFCCVASYSQMTIVLDISGGEIIKEGEQKGQVGYYRIKQTYLDKTKKAEKRTVVISCRGKGLNPCPQPYCFEKDTTSGLTSGIYDAIIAKVCGLIDLGKVEGHFEESGFSCIWENGRRKKNVYNYKLVIT
jgi:hypothetical protein